MIVDRNYIFTLYQMGAGAIFRYLQQIENRVEDAEARVARSQQAQVDQLITELIRTRTTLDNSAAYLKGWLGALKGDARLIVTAASAAQRAADFILGRNTQETGEGEPASEQLQ